MGDNKNSKIVINSVVPLFPQQQKEVVDELKDPLALVPVPFVPQQQSEVVGELQQSEVVGELKVPVPLVPEQQSEVGEPKEPMPPFLQPQNEVGELEVPNVFGSITPVSNSCTNHLLEYIQINKSFLICSTRTLAQNRTRRTSKMMKRSILWKKGLQ